MNEHPLAVSIVLTLLCAVAVGAAVVWLADAGVPSETAVPVIVVALLALRSAARHSPTH